MKDGVVMEIGGLDGLKSSQSLLFEKIGWKRIIVEGNPQFSDGLKMLTSAATVNSVVCNEVKQDVHFITDHSDNYTSGKYSIFFYAKVTPFNKKAIFRGAGIHDKEVCEAALSRYIFCWRCRQCSIL